MQKTNRMDRLNGLFKKEVYNIITTRLKNPLITEMFSIMDVITSKDLRHCKIFISVFSSDEAKKQSTFNEIVKSAKAIRAELARTMKLRTVPELHFALDTTMEYSNKIEQLLKGLKTED